MKIRDLYLKKRKSRPVPDMAADSFFYRDDKNLGNPATQGCYNRLRVVLWSMRTTTVISWVCFCQPASVVMTQQALQKQSTCELSERNESGFVMMIPVEEVERLLVPWEREMLPSVASSGLLCNHDGA